MTAEEITELIRLTGSRDSKIYAHALRRLEALDGETLRPLIEPLLVHLLHPHAGIRRGVLTLLQRRKLVLPIQDIWSLGLSPPLSDMREQQRRLDELPTEPSALVSLLGTHDAILRHAIAQRLVTLGEAAHAPLFAALTRKRPFVASRAAAVLAYQGVGEAVEPIFRLWQSTSVHDEQLHEALVSALVVLLGHTPEVPLSLLIEILAAPGLYSERDAPPSPPYAVKISAAKCVVRQAEKYRTPEYRLALPYLKSTYTDLSDYHAALERALKAVPNATLPIPAEPSTSPNNLPIPTEER
jgi:hypothetical protein